MYDIMDLTEELVSDLVKHVTGSHQTTFHTQVGGIYYDHKNADGCSMAKSTKSIGWINPFNIMPSINVF